MSDLDKEELEATKNIGKTADELSEEEIKEAVERLEYFEPDDLVECSIYRNCIEKIHRSIRPIRTREKSK